MRTFIPVLALVLATAGVVYTIIGGESYTHLVESREALVAERLSNAQLRDKVDTLRREVYGLRHDERRIEKAARNELVLARPNELVLIFEGDSPAR